MIVPIQFPAVKIHFVMGVFIKAILLEICIDMLCPKMHFIT